MNIQLIQGHFSAEEVIEIVTKMMNIKIKFHEKKISNSSNEEDIKMRENKIKKLQNDLKAFREALSKKEHVNVEANIAVN